MKNLVKKTTVERVVNYGEIKAGFTSSIIFVLTKNILQFISGGVFGFADNI